MSPPLNFQNSKPNSGPKDDLFDFKAPADVEIVMGAGAEADPNRMVKKPPASFSASQRQPQRTTRVRLGFTRCPLGGLFSPSQTTCIFKVAFCSSEDDVPSGTMMNPDSVRDA